MAANAAAACARDSPFLPHRLRFVMAGRAIRRLRCDDAGTFGRHAGSSQTGLGTREPASMRASRGWSATPVSEVKPWHWRKVAQGKSRRDIAW